MTKRVYNKIQQIIENHWYKKPNVIVSILLFIPCILFFIISQTRRLLYKYGVLHSYKLPVPVVIIGNISVGGVGKTPLCKHIAQQLIAQGIQVGIILRGYKAKNKYPKIVIPSSDSLEVGDEALIYAQNNIPVAIGSNRYLAGCKILKKHPNIQIILSDDGLQHYRLKRDYEVVVIDQTRMLGNKFVLPMGSLRESPSRLKTVNAIVINGKYNNINDFAKSYNLNNILIEQQTIILKNIYNPVTGVSVDANYFIESKEYSKLYDKDTLVAVQGPKTKSICAIAAMGNPIRFFDFISAYGIKLNSKIAYPDHHHYTEKDIPDNFDMILVTEKDYTKLAKLNNDKIWVVQVEVQLEPNTLIKQIIGLIK